MQDTHDYIKEIVHLYEDLKLERASWLATWKELAKNFDSTGYRDEEQANEQDKKKDIINKDILDNTGIFAAQTLASGMQGGMTSPARAWFALRERTYSTSVPADTKKFLDEVTERMRIVFNSSNFYNVMFQVYEQLGVFGTACVFEEADLDGFRFTCIPVGTYVFDVDDMGKVDTVIRKMWLSWKQIEQKFGSDVLPDQVKQKRKERKFFSTKKHAVYHAVVPRPKNEVKQGSINPKHRAYASIYYMDEKKDGKNIVLRESGYESMPFFGVRWHVQAGDIYGKSPALNVLGEVKLLQTVVEDTITGIHKQVDPPVNAPASLDGVGVDVSAGAINYIKTDAGGGLPITSTYQVAIDVNASMMWREQQRTDIKIGMFNDLFRMLIDSNRRQMTATEVASKEQEKLILIGPVLERLQNELFIPLIERTYELMARNNALPELPESMQGGSIQIEFVSTLAQAQKVVSTGALEQYVGFVGNLAQAKPDVLDILDSDTAARKYGEYLGVESSVNFSQDKVTQARQQRAQAQAQQEQSMQMAQMAQTAKTMGDTPVAVDGAPNALDALIGGLGGL